MEIDNNGNSVPPMKGNQDSRREKMALKKSDLFYSQNCLEVEASNIQFIGGLPNCPIVQLYAISAPCT